MYTLKSVVRRGVAFGSAAALALAAVAPLATPAFADALNPLTNRSLTLTSSAPGWDYKDGSGNSTYAPPGSGANGQKTGNTFDFKVSTDTTAEGSEVKAFTFQYCTKSAGDCIAPGDNGLDGSDRGDDTDSTSDLNVVTSSPEEVSSADFGSIISAANGDVLQTPQGGISFNPLYSTQPQNNFGGNFVVYYESAPGTWVQSSGWEMTASNKEDGIVGAGHDAATGKNNFITLTNEDGQGFAGGTRVKIIFFATDTNYITNPGSKEFFVKINNYSSDSTLDETTLIDGGVTVANVMNHSISIRTKVLETMEFSVGTVDPNTLDSTDGEGSQLHDANGNQKHGVCDRILTKLKRTDSNDKINVLRMGNEIGEDSLETDATYSTHSYWRLSSNSSAGATVYYSGVTLSNTVGDKIAAIGAQKEAPIKGSEQFGLAIASDGAGDYLVNYDVERDEVLGVFENGADNGTNGVHATVETDLTTGGVVNPSYHTPRLAPLVPKGNYSDGAGVVNEEYGSIDTAFAFEESSNLIPVAIASQDDEVVDCVTAKMRYIANIAATTPAGIYTTKINYIAAPQY